MSAAPIRIRGSLVGSGARADWVRAGAALFGAAWGSNQFTPMRLRQPRFARMLALLTALWVRLQARPS